MRILLSRGLVYQAKKTRKNNLRETPLAVTKSKEQTKKKHTSFKNRHKLNKIGTEQRYEAKIKCNK